MSAHTTTHAGVSGPGTVWWVIGVVLASIGLVALDHLTGPFIRVSIGFVVPVGLVAYRWSWRLALGLGLLLGASSIWLVLGSDAPWLVAPEAVNFGLSLLIFGAVAAAGRELARSRSPSGPPAGPLSVCGGCGRVRDDSGRWGRLENVVSHDTTAVVGPAVCPECEMRALA